MPTIPAQSRFLNANLLLFVEETARMHYFVQGTNGAEYGPATLDILQVWKSQGRIAETSVLRDEQGNRFNAAALRGLFAPAPAPAPAAPLAPTNEAYQPYARPGLAPGATDGLEEYLKKFNWGAFLLSPFWLYSHNKRLLGLLFFVMAKVVPSGPFTGIWTGIYGNRIAWESGRFSTVAEMKECHRKWTKWGIGSIIFSLGLVLFAVIVLQLAS